MIYLKSFKLLAPFDNDVVQTLNFHWEYWKTYGFEHINTPKNVLNDLFSTYSDSFSKRGSSAKLGDYTLSDFKEQTRPGDTSAVYVFSVISTKKEIVDRTIEEVRLGIMEYVNRRNGQGYPHSLSETKETVFAFDGIKCEELDTQKKVKKWVELLELFPYVDKLYEWLLVNRNYPTVS
jgi:hypothetical protein